MRLPRHIERSSRTLTSVWCAIVAWIVVASILCGSTAAWAQSDPLPSWNEGVAKRAIIEFVTAVTRDGSPDFVAGPERVATFDNDGTLWIEQPTYVQFAFALDRVKALAPLHPEWKDKQPFKAVLEGDMATIAAAGEHGAAEIVAATHAGVSPEEFRQTVKEWLATAKHPATTVATTSSSISRCWKCWRTCARTGLRHSSRRVGVSSSFECLRRSATAFRPSRSLGRARYE